MRERFPGYGLWIAALALISVGAWHWAQLETPSIPLREMALMVVIALAPVFVTRTWNAVAGVVALVVCLPLAIGAASGLWPGSSGAHRYPSAVYLRIDHGAHDWFNATTPFDYGRFGEVDTDARLLFMLLVAAIGFTAILRRWALVSIALALVLFAFPATVLDVAHPWVRSAWFLAAALITLRLVPRRARTDGGSGQAWALGTAVVVLGLVVSALPGVHKGAFLGWHSWDPLASSAPPRSLAYVWDQSYAPLHWRGKPTAVLNVWSPKPLYWKVGTLDTFDLTTNSWVETPWPLKEGLRSTDNGSTNVPDSALPPLAQHAAIKNTAEVRVQVLALADPRLVSADQTLQWSAPINTPFKLSTNGSAITSSDLPRNSTYSSIVYDPDPVPRQLQTVSTQFPASIRPDLLVGGRVMTTWPKAVQSPDLAIDPALVAASNHVWTASKADSDTTEWAAVADVEAYFRSRPFVYDLTPKFTKNSPVLAQFMSTGHHGYCQMFSGSMALVLRLHGIPARVAVGFTTGQSPSTANAPYVVTDRDAHSWVEVYYPGYGWLPFDPTPGRHLATNSSVSNPTYTLKHPNGTPAVDLKVAPNGPASPTKTGNDPASRHGITPRAHGAGGPSVDTTPQGSSAGGGFITGALALALSLAVLISLIKFGAVRWRYLRRGPRAQASAAYRELATFVGDQGIADSPERTFEDLSSEIKRVFGVDASSFADHASRARYAPDAQAEPASREIRSDMRDIKRGIRRQLSIRDRVFGAVRVRSALAQITNLD